MDKRIEAIELYKKLLARAADPASSPAESASALKTAQRLMEKHRIEAADLVAKGEVAEDVTKGEVADSGMDVLLGWVWGVFFSVCEVNRCFAYHSKRKVTNSKGKDVHHAVLMAIGTASDREAVRVTFEYIRMQIQHMCLQGARNANMSKSPKWMNEWRNGATAMIAHRLREQYKEAKREARLEAATNNGNTALVRIDAEDARISREIKRVFNESSWTISKGKTTKVDDSGTAYNMGVSAGARVDIGNVGGHKQLR